ncbi:hypothetical protein Gohar_026856 [Gossypium harknessii]|uniref:Uncharacterized protein n=1 Tax=Gossypium harknessii TaxID=34285 RepID=A0A7J9HSV6_9ROSI|nr:hypothetical protein [Gossypium harknessii]
MGKASGDRHLALFAFAVYGLIVFPKALGYGGSFSLGLGVLEEIQRDTNQVGSNLELVVRNLFQPFPLRNVYLVAPKKKKNLCVSIV